MNFDNPNRPWPVPDRPYALVMKWHELLFMHWRIDSSLLRPLVPTPLEIETFDGSAWIGIVPFRMSGTRPRWLPAVPGLSNFPELNVRTYVTAGGKPGVYFFSLDAANMIAVQAARKVFHLNYCHAKMRLTRDAATGEVIYESCRTQRGMPAAEFNGSYWPLGCASESSPGELEYFLTERYCLYAAAPDGRTFRGDIFHKPWLLRPAEALITRNTMLDPLGLATPTERPLLHYADEMQVVAWWLEPI